MEDVKKWTFRGHSRRVASTPIDTIVIHYTGPGTALGLCKAWSSPKRKSGTSSAHFVLARDGTVNQGVSLSRTAHHAGPGIFLGYDGTGVIAKPRVMNRRSVGIEISNAGWVGDAFAGSHRNPLCHSPTWDSYTDEQYEALNSLISRIKSAIPSIRFITGHEDISNSQTKRRFLNIRKPGAKVDPGPAFEWWRLECLVNCGIQRVYYDFDNDEFVIEDNGRHPTISAPRSDNQTSWIHHWLNTQWGNLFT